MNKKVLVITLGCLFAFTGATVYGQGGVKSGPDPSTIRDSELEKDSMHNLEVARNYFKLRKAYVAALKRCEEIIEGNPNFARIEEVLWMAGQSSLALADGKGKQSPSLYVVFDGTDKKTLTAEQFRELGRQYLLRLVRDFPNGKYREEAEASLKTVAEVGETKPD